MSKKLKADVSLLAICVVWGVSYPVISLALEHVGPYTFLTMRYILASLLLFPFALRSFKMIDKKILLGGTLIGISLFLGSVFQTVGLLYTTPSKSGFLTGMNVVFVTLFVAIIYRKMPDVKSIIGVLASVIGLCLMSLDGKMGMNIGDGLTLLCAVAFAFQILLVSKYSKGEYLVIISYIQMTIVGVLSLIPAIFAERLTLPINKVTIGSIVFTAIFCTILTYMVQNKMQPYTKPTHAAIIFLSEPVFSAIFSSFIGDKLTGNTLIGCAFILLGILFINIKK